MRDAVADGMSEVKAARLAGVSRMTVRAWLWEGEVMKWTEEEQELVMLYGLCPVCYAPRRVSVDVEDEAATGPDVIAYTMSLVCSADPTHVQDDGPGVYPPYPRAQKGK